MSSQRPIPVLLGTGSDTSDRLAQCLSLLNFEPSSGSEIAAMNSEMARDLDLPSPCFCGPSPAALDRLRKDFADRACHLLVGTEHRIAPMAITGPHLEWLLPFWLEMLEVCRLEPRILLMVGNPGRPEDPARGIAQRHERFHEWRWVAEMLEHLTNIGSRPRLVVSAEMLVSEPAGQITRVAEFFGLRVDAARLAPLAAPLTKSAPFPTPAGADRPNDLPRLALEIEAALKRAAGDPASPPPEGFKETLNRWQADFADVRGLLDTLREQHAAIARESGLCANQASTIKEQERRHFEALMALARLADGDAWLLARNWKFRPDALFEDLQDLLRARDAEIDSLTSALESFEIWQRSWFQRATGRWHRFPEAHRMGALRRLAKVFTGKPGHKAEEAGPPSLHSAGSPAALHESDSPPEEDFPEPPAPEELRESAHDWLQRHWSALAPLSTFPTSGESPRLSVLTDSVDSHSLFGGVGTALILGALTANRMGANLRLITRTSVPDPGAFASVLAANGIELHGEFEVMHAPVSGHAELPVTSQDRFLSTSWWTAQCILPQIACRHLVHLLQEDERMFYPNGDWRRRCHNVLNTPGLRLIVNSRLLYDALGSGIEPLDDLTARAVWFEPAFPGASPGRKPANEPRKLFFYARPNHSRNLFALGLEALTRAGEAGIFPAGEWEVYLVGAHIPALTLPGALRAHRVEGLNWKAYQALVRTMDAGLVLMDTPHPSYPPLDLAAAGAAVLTCRYGNKTDLGFYSKNLITADPNVPALVAGLEKLAKAALDDTQRALNTRADNISRDWCQSLAGTVEFLAEHFACGEGDRTSAKIPCR